MVFSAKLVSTLRTVSSVSFFPIFLLSLNQLQMSAAATDGVVTTMENDGTILTELRLLKATNARQEDAIAMLENKVKNHEERVIHLEEMQSSKSHLQMKPNSVDAKFKNSPVKRPARLLPMSLFRKREKVTHTSVRRMPSSCAELNDIGHTLNAFYIVRDNEVNSSKLQTIYCDFQSLPSDEGDDPAKSANTIMEKRLGFLDMKSSNRGVYFYVQRNSSLAARSPSTLRYTIQSLNIGGGMNRATGVFTAPRPGIYYFNFAGVKTAEMDSLTIELRVNGVRTGESFYGFGVLQQTPISIHSTLKLKSGDRVYIFIERGSLTSCANICIHFTGWLLEEDM